MNDVQKEIKEIKDLLQLILDRFAWIIRATSRFRARQRVEFSRTAAHRGFKIARNGKKIRGTVVKIDGPFLLQELMDGRKHPNWFHHCLFNPVVGEKLF